MYVCIEFAVIEVKGDKQQVNLNSVPVIIFTNGVVLGTEGSNIYYYSLYDTIHLQTQIEHIIFT